MVLVQGLLPYDLLPPLIANSRDSPVFAAVIDNNWNVSDNVHSHIREIATRTGTVDSANTVFGCWNVPVGRKKCRCR
jgi:hypothetical protein